MMNPATVGEFSLAENGPGGSSSNLTTEGCTRTPPDNRDVSAEQDVGTGQDEICDERNTHLPREPPFIPLLL
jgi:hypothetical protein